MSRRSARGERPSDEARERTRRALENAAAEHQRRVIVPHCPVCTRPCCALTDVVLDLDWRRTQALYQITSSRRAFDRSLQDGTGPRAIKEQDGRYYAHSEPCPAYTADKLCGVYGTDTKPPGCTDFPLYLDDDAVTADLRCEALDPDAVERDLRAALPAGTALAREMDGEHGVFVSFSVPPRR